MEVLVENKPESEALSELYKPLEDPLIKRCIEIVEHEDDPVSKPKEIWSKLFPKPRRSWLPTGCLVRKKWCPHITTDVVLLCSNFCNFRNC
jgi:hypothetical protein